MVETQIQVNKPFLSLKYDIDNDLLIGDNTFEVSLFNIGDEESENTLVTIEHDENFVLDYNPIYATERPITITVTLAEGAVIPDGVFNFGFKLVSEDAKDVNFITSIVAKNDEPEPDEELVYKLKYFIQRENYRLNIYENVFESVVLVPVEVNGTCEKSYQEKKDLYEPIVASELKINLEASLELTFEDLYSENERNFKVEVLRGSEIEFLGFILPDGIWEDWVSDKWILNISASDGLAALKNTSFAQDISNIDGSPLNFYGRMTVLQIFDICLKKTGLNLNSNTIIYLEYFEHIGGTILGSLYTSVERYFQNNNGTDSEAMDCDAVLRSWLQVFNATLVQFKGEWWIYRSTDLKSKNIVSTFGNGISGFNYTYLFGDVLGSQINDSEFFHCTGNQKKSIAPSVQAYQVSYQYGGAKNILANGGLVFYGLNKEAVYGIDMPGWNIPSPPDGLNNVEAGVRPGWSYGVRGNVKTLDPLPILLELNQSLTITEGAGMTLSIKYRNDGQNSLYLNFAFGISVGGGVINWFNLSTGQWQTTKAINRVDNFYEVVNGGQSIKYGNLDSVYQLEVASPYNGDVVIQIFRNGHGPGAVFGVHGVSLSASDKNIKSTDYTGRRTSKTSSAVKSNVSVFNGDSGSDLFVGTIFKADSDTPTEGWNRYYYIESGMTMIKTEYPEFKEVLEINAEDNLRISPRPMTIFEGDVKGYIPYVNFFTIDGFKRMRFDEEVDKKFQFTKWSYSFDKDIIKMVAKEYSDEYAFGEDLFTVNIKENFSNEVQVKI